MSLLLALSLWSVPAYGDSGVWKEIRRARGIVVWRRPMPGTSLVQFKARGEIKASLRRVAAVLADLDRLCEWRANCKEARRITRRKDNHLVGYYRLFSKFPLVADRDVVLDAWFDVDEVQRKLWARFKSMKHPDQPVVPKVVRMPSLSGFWLLEPIAENRVRATYQLFADPGGSIPKWLVNWVSRKLPYAGIVGLRKQVRKPVYDEIEKILSRHIDLSAFDSAE